jgi:hypothetical protein
MSRQTTPPTSQSVSTGSVLSKTTPLKRDIHGSQAHSSSPYEGPPARYLEMTREACEKFVGPMPVDKFLSDFIPEAPEARPANEIMFSHPTVSEYEDAFVSLYLQRYIGAQPRYRSVQLKRRISVPNSSLLIRRTIPMAHIT